MELFVVILVLFFPVLFGVSFFMLNHYPNSRITKFIRDHIVTDEDLEPRD